MEKIKSLCVMRELIKAVNDMESQMQERFGVTINEAMLLCCIDNETLTASAISEIVGLTPSNTSKVLRSVESKGFLTRTMGDTDRRQMRFTLTGNGIARLKAIKEAEINLPAFLTGIFNG